MINWSTCLFFGASYNEQGRIVFMSGLNNENNKNENFKKRFNVIISKCIFWQSRNLVEFMRLRDNLKKKCDIQTKIQTYRQSDS